MITPRSFRIVHKNDLCAYLGNWKNIMTMMGRMKEEKEEHYPVGRLPTPAESYAFNTHDLCVLLFFLDEDLRILEKTPLHQFNDQAYAGARVFLKTSFIIFPVILDDLAGIIEYFYNIKEPKVEVKKAFNDLLVKANSARLPQDLARILEQANSWFPEIKVTRDDVIHYYDSILISFKEIQGGGNIVGHFHIGGRQPYAYEDTRGFLGHIFCEYQKLIDDLLDHFDAKFMEWYNFKPHRDFSILEGQAGIILWWAHKFGNYRHKDLQTIENNDGEAENETI